uniref:Uncharacterized protein n=1 Tax=Mycena chlorophos TaxID=658473 RepID=A0ABQ0LT27_MYCCL|nr:predicted protein [Mycena chlorophos]
MVFAAGLLSLALFALPALAAPRGAARSTLASRVAGRRSGPKIPSNGINALTKGSSNVEYSQNWAGASFESAKNTYKAVTGSFVVPTPSAPKGGSGSYAASAWVGIDGDTCETGILQTGVDFTVDNGKVSYDGDTINVTVVAASTTSGTATITNESTGVTVSKSLKSSAKLCFENAEWIVEDFEEGDSLVKFADFGSVTFTNAVATLQSGGTTGPTGAVLIDIEQSNKVLTSTSTTSDSVTVSYT